MIPRFAYYRLRYTLPLLAAVLAWLGYKASITPSPGTEVGRFSSQVQDGRWVLTDKVTEQAITISQLRYGHSFRIQSAEAMRHQDSTWTTYWADERSPLGLWINCSFRGGKAVLEVDTRYRHALGWDYQAGRFLNKPDTLTLEVTGTITPLGKVKRLGNTLELIVPAGDTLSGVIPVATLDF